MWIRSVQFKNLKCFKDTGELQFLPGINLIVGQNNVGKSTLLESLQLKFSSNPHLSEATKPQRNSVLNPVSFARVEFGTSGAELRNLVFTQETSFRVPMPRGQVDGKKTLEEIFGRKELSIKVDFQSVDGNHAQLVPQALPAHGLFNEPYDSYVEIRISETRDGYKAKGPHQGGMGQDFSWASANHLRERVYFFKAERPVQGRCGAGASRVLASNAYNLAEVLVNLQGSNIELNADFMECVRSVIPSVKHVAVAHTSANDLELRVWTVPTSTRREDLTVPLNQSGTGVGQVLAILYVVLTSDEPRTIVIDEPGSFLHPGAARKLIEILKRNPQHQYIISTHAPEIIGMLLDARIFLIESRGSEAVITQIDTADLKDRTRLLTEIGVRLADVYGYDFVMWVEGQTEEACFPLIAKHFNLPNIGVAFRGVRETADFQSHVKREEIRRIYDKLSAGGALLPKALAFVFDREGLSEREIADLTRMKGVSLLPRRMYENYLLDARAITHVLNQTETFREKPLELAAVQQCLNTHAPDVSLPDLDGAAVLKRVFAELSEQKHIYRKIEHGEALTGWVLEHAPERLHEVRDLLRPLLTA